MIQVFSSYGAKSNDEWLMDYGFVFPNNHIKSIRIEDPIIPADDPYFKEKLFLIKSNSQ